MLFVLKKIEEFTLVFVTAAASATAKALVLRYSLLCVSKDEISSCSSLEKAELGFLWSTAHRLQKDCSLLAQTKKQILLAEVTKHSFRSQQLR